MVRSKARAALAVGLLASMVACTVHEQETPSLTGPSEFGTSIGVQVSPDVLAQDGSSQSLVTITARDSNGQPLRSLSLRAEISVGGVASDFGSLSARNVVTDGSGKATLIYTAPAAPAFAVDSGTVVQIEVTPIGTDFGNSTSRVASIRLVPPSVVIPPGGLKPAFTVNPPTAADHQALLFDASSSQPTTGQNAIVSYDWDFGDGGHSSGVTTQHTYNNPGTYFPRLTVSDAFGRQASAAAATNAASGVIISQGDAPTANFTTSPGSPIPGQTVFFNAASSTPSAGRSIVSYQWDFGDGTSGSGIQTSHAYSVVGSYTVTLTVVDDIGHKGVLSQPLPVQADTPPTASFTFTATAGHSGAFDASASAAGTGRRIVSYTWSFGDGTSGSGSALLHSYPAAGSFTVTLTVVDDTGKSGTKTQVITVP